MGKEFDFEDFKASALEQLKEGKPVLGKDGVFAPLLEHLLNAALEGEMDAHMDFEERSGGNRRNGYTGKQIQSPVGELSIQTPRDRDATFDPVMVKKRERILADSLADRIIGLYAVGTSTREISNLLEEQFGNRISAETISAVTDRILPELQSWRNRPLDAVYPIVWMDAIHYKVMDEKNRPVTRAVYNVLALTGEGRKELLGMYIAKSEGANAKLDKLLLAVNEAYDALSERKQPFDAEAVKDLFQGSVDTQMTLLKLFDHLTDELKARVGIDRAAGAVTTYTYTYRALAEFIKKKFNASDLAFGQLNEQFIREFQDFVLQDKGLAMDTLRHYLALLKKVCKIAYKEGHSEKHYFAHYKLPKQKEATPKALSREDFEKIRDLVIPEHRISHIITRDLFLFACYTGTSYADTVSITQDNIITSSIQKKN